MIRLLVAIVGVLVLPVVVAHTVRVAARYDATVFLLGWAAAMTFALIVYKWAHRGAA